jgi:glutamate racemase
VNADGPIGVLAGSGRGLAAVVGELRARLPHEDVLSVADDGWAPWSRRPGHVVARRVGVLAEELAGGGAKLILLASLQGSLDGLAAARAAGVPVIGLEPAAVASRALAAAASRPVTVVVEPGAVRPAQLAAALKRVRAGGLPVAEAGAELPEGVLAIASPGVDAALVAGRPVVAATGIAAERVHRLLVRERALARRRRAGRWMAMSSFPAAAYRG